MLISRHRRASTKLSDYRAQHGRRQHLPSQRTSRKKKR
jgi:hypothetical protein